MAKAIKVLTEVSRKYPELPSAHVLMYQILAQMNQPNAARFQLELAVRETPSDPEPYVIIGNIALQERRVAEATMDFDKAKQLLETYANKDRKGAMEQQTLSGIAQLAEASEDWKGAESRLRKLLELAPEDLVAHQRLARSLFWQGKAKESYEMLKAAKKIDREKAAKDKTREVFLTPEAIMAQYYDQFEGSGSKNPEIWFKSALKNAPDDLTTRQVVAVWALEKGKIAFAKEQAEAALRIEAADAAKPVGEQRLKGSFVGRMHRGLVALWEKKWDEAENYFQKVILEVPNDFVARNNLALALVEQDDPQKKQRAQAYADANYKDNNKSPDALSTLGWVYFRRGEFDQARLALGEAVKATGGNLNNADTATYLAHILYHQDQKWQTKELLDNILKGDRPFSMRPEAEKLYEKVKDEKKPADTTPAPTVTPKSNP
jgi:tetratricopeptide (TPR) repeat protein